MSRMLDALKQLSNQAQGSSPPDQSPVPPSAATPPEAVVPPEAPPSEPQPPAADHGQRMKELLVKHLAAPAVTEVYRGRPAWGVSPPESGSAMTVPLDNLRNGFEPLGSPVAGEAAVAPLAAPAVDVSAESDGSPEQSNVVSVDSVEELLAALDEESAGGEQVTLSFSGATPREALLGPVTIEPALWDEMDSQANEESQESHCVHFEVAAEPAREPAEESIQEPIEPQPAESPVVQIAAPAPEPVLEKEPQSPGPMDVDHSIPSSEADLADSGHSLLDHLADKRPLTSYQLEEEEPVQAPVTPVSPLRTIRRGKTRLEERVLDNLSHPSRSLPYRELAERLLQDLRLLSGRCLLFTGIGSASRADDLLPHLASLLAEDDAEVVLVDADFKRAAMTVGLGALKEPGLGELAEASGRSEGLVLPTLLPQVALLPAGRKALPETLGSADQIGQLLAQLEERYSLVLIDGGAHTGPLVPALARLCDATYFVVRLGATDASAATTALKTFRANGARIMGCVATQGQAAA